MKQRNLNKLVLLTLIINIVLFVGWIVISWIDSLDLTLQQWMAIGAIGGTVFIVIDTVEIILLRQGQRAWTHTPGKTLVRALEDFYNEIQKSEQAQAAFMMLAQNVFAAGFGEMGADNGKPYRSVKIDKSELPEKLRWIAPIVNQPRVQKRIVDEITGEAKKTTKPDGKVPRTWG